MRGSFGKTHVGAYSRRVVLTPSRHRGPDDEDVAGAEDAACSAVLVEAAVLIEGDAGFGAC